MAQAQSNLSASFHRAGLFMKSAGSSMGRNNSNQQAASMWCICTYGVRTYIMHEILHLATLGVKPLGAQIRGAIIYKKKSYLEV